jgi:hypothetical protein
LATDGVACGAAAFGAAFGAGFVVGAGVGAAACRRDVRCAGRCAGALRVEADDEWEGAFSGVAAPATGAVEVDGVAATCLGFVLLTVGSGFSTAATTSPARSLSAGATPDERTDAPPPGSRTREREIDAAASAAGKALLTGN